LEPLSDFNPPITITGPAQQVPREGPAPLGLGSRRLHLIEDDHTTAEREARIYSFVRNAYHPFEHAAIRGVPIGGNQSTGNEDAARHRAPSIFSGIPCPENLISSQSRDFINKSDGSIILRGRQDAVDNLMAYVNQGYSRQPTSSGSYLCALYALEISLQVAVQTFSFLPLAGDFLYLREVFRRLSGSPEQAPLRGNIEVDDVWKVLREATQTAGGFQLGIISDSADSEGSKHEVFDVYLYGDTAPIASMTVWLHNDNVECLSPGEDRMSHWSGIAPDSTDISIDPLLLQESQNQDMSNNLSIFESSDTSESAKYTPSTIVSGQDIAESSKLSSSRSRSTMVKDGFACLHPSCGKRFGTLSALK